MSMLVLVVQTGKYKGRRLKVTDAELLIGRDEDAAIRIGSSEVSRQHCLLTPTDGGLSVRDLGSSNGTFVDGAPTGQSEVLLKPGSSLSVGPMTFQLIDTSTEAVVPGPQEPAQGKDPSLSDDDIASWLTDASDTSHELSTSDTTIIVGDESPSGSQPPIQPPPKKKREFASVAEEAADIIRRHQALLEGRDDEVESED